MKVKDLAKEKPKIKLGTAGGGFVFCGVLDAEVCDKIDIDFVTLLAHRLDDNRHSANYLKTRLTYDAYNMKCAAQAEKAIKGYQNLTEEQEKELRDQFKPTKDGYKKYLTETKEQIVRREAEATRYAKRLIGFCPSAEREVIKMYKSIDEPGTQIVIMDGEEIGHYWTTKEYDTASRSAERWREICG